MTGTRTGTGNRMGRGRYALAMAVIGALFLALSFGLGLRFGLRNVLGIYLPLAGLLLLARLALAARRWRDIGLPGWPVSITLTLATGLTAAALPILVTLCAVLALVGLEIALPLRPDQTQPRG